MKKLIAILLFTFGIGLTTAQTATTAKISTEKKAEQKKAKKNVNSSSTKLKKDGTPDKRYKVNKKLKKDGTPDRRYKVNK